MCGPYCVPHQILRLHDPLFGVDQISFRNANVSSARVFKLFKQTKPGCWRPLGEWENGHIDRSSPPLTICHGRTMVSTGPNCSFQASFLAVPCEWSMAETGNPLRGQSAERKRSACKKSIHINFFQSECSPNFIPPLPSPLSLIPLTCTLTQASIEACPRDVM